ncbi:hypothetical protein, partial [Clostridium tyrobutyricum]
DDNYAYFINIYPHNKPNLWAYQKMIGILYNNWPDSMEKFHIKEISSLSKKIDDKAYTQLRKSGVSTLVEIEKNKVFGLIGGGYASDGSYIEAVRQHDYWHNYLSRIEFYIKENYYKLKQQMLCFDKRSLDKPLKIQMLTLTNDELIILEKERMVIIKCNYRNSNISMSRLRDIIYENSYSRLT